MTPDIRAARIRPAGPEDVDAIRRIARAAYALYVPRIGREPAPMVADFTASIEHTRASIRHDYEKMNTAAGRTVHSDKVRRSACVRVRKVILYTLSWQVLSH